MVWGVLIGTPLGAALLAAVYWAIQGERNAAAVAAICAAITTFIAVVGLLMRV